MEYFFLYQSVVIIPVSVSDTESKCKPLQALHGTGSRDANAVPAGA